MSTRPANAWRQARDRAQGLVRPHLMALLDLPAANHRVDELEGQLRLLAAAHHETRDALGATGREVVDARARLDAVPPRFDHLERHIDAVQAELTRQLVERTDPLRRAQEIVAMMTWLSVVELPEAELVSIVMPTFDRADVLPRAIDSVLRQRYSNWELVIVVDGSTDGTDALLARYDDSRIRVLHQANAGCTAARNTALDTCRGPIIAYLDDDNWLHPDWLRAVVWAFGEHPEADVLYGVRIIDSPARLEDPAAVPDMPVLQFEPWNHERLRQYNYIDMGTISHRAGLPEAHFDPALRTLGDWDILLRLTAETDPLELPAVALAYTSDGPQRLSLSDDEIYIAAVVDKGIADGLGRPDLVGEPGPADVVAPPD